MTYRRRWKSETLIHCGLQGTRRDVFHTLITFGDWKGRSHKPYRELAKLAGVSTRSCVSALAYLTEAGFVLIQQRGTSHRPAWLQVVPYEPATDPTSVQSRCTEDPPSLVQNSYVANRVNYTQLVVDRTEPHAGASHSERSEAHSSGNGAMP